MLEGRGGGGRPDGVVGKGRSGEMAFQWSHEGKNQHPWNEDSRLRKHVSCL